MSGDTSNANAWANADVYIADLGTSLPASAEDPFPAGWDFVGILDGEAGFATSRSWDTTDQAGWGIGVFYTSERNYVETVTWTALETNEVTYALAYPGSTDEEIVVPRPEQKLIAFETVDGDKILRQISAGTSKTFASELARAEGAVDKYPFETKIYPTAAGALWVRQASGLASV